MFCSRAAKISARTTASGSFSSSTNRSNSLGGPGVGVGLEGHHQPLVPEASGGGEQGVELVGVVGVVVVDLRPVPGALVLEPAVRPGEGGKACLHGRAGQARAWAAAAAARALRTLWRP